ncbi:MAG TPA: TrkA family potassium uptake protein [Eubacteriales bacterium]|mgnify:CR=1 FL=1|nr:TrkA family potassium uptake protein [Eubacteriales bacterium]
MKSVLVIGMGKFGKFLATKLQELDNDVMVIDKDEAIIEDIASRFANAQIGDCTNPDVLRALGVDEFDVCFVAFDENFQSSLEITSLLSEMGAKKIVSMASRETQAKFLLQVGASEVVYPEKDIAETLAVKYSSSNIFDYFPLTDEYSIVEIPILPEWTGKTIAKVDVRKNHNLNILAIKNNGELLPSPNPDYCFLPDDHIIVLGNQNEVLAIASKTEK